MRLFMRIISSICPRDYAFLIPQRFFQLLTVALNIINFGTFEVKLADK